MRVSLNDIEQAATIVYEAMAPTPQLAWPLIGEAAGLEVWVKHENHTPIGAFKVRGGLVHMRKRRLAGDERGVITATRGNHGQSIPFAGAREAIPVTIVVPHGNAAEKNAAMRALGAELIETGADFDAAADAARTLAGERGLAMLPSFHEDLVVGVATYSAELLQAAGELDALYVPIGLGSGACGAIAARDGLGLKTAVIGVVAKNANCYRLSFEAGEVVTTNAAATFADGMAVRKPDAAALEWLKAGLERIVEVGEDDIADAMRLYFRATHNVAEGAGAASLAALMSEREKMAGKRVGVVLSGGNVDTDKFAAVLEGKTPPP